jgi:hypothetical protein
MTDRIVRKVELSNFAVMYDLDNRFVKAVTNPYISHTLEVFCKLLGENQILL